MVASTKAYEVERELAQIKMCMPDFQHVLDQLADQLPSAAPEAEPKPNGAKVKL